MWFIFQTFYWILFFLAFYRNSALINPIAEAKYWKITKLLDIFGVIAIIIKLAMTKIVK